MYQAATRGAVPSDHLEIVRAGERFERDGGEGLVPEGDRGDVVLERQIAPLIEKAIALAREAAQLDPMDPNAHREIGHALIYLGAIDEAVESLHSAAQLGPHRSDVLFHYGDGLVHLGKMQEARDVMDKAHKLNPLAPDVYHWVSATADYFLSDYAAASRTLKRMQNPEPAARVIAAVEAMNGKLEEAAR